MASPRNLLRQIEKRITRRDAEPVAVEKERSRAAATELDCAIKLEDLARKYSLKIRVEAGDVLVVTLPVWEISARVIRNKGERLATFHWNPALGSLESPWCEHCFQRAHPIFLCDDGLHFLCRDCFSACPGCSRQFCRACHSRCSCGAGLSLASGPKKQRWDQDRVALGLLIAVERMSVLRSKGSGGQAG